MFFHDFVIVVLSMILIFVGYIIIIRLVRGGVNTGLLEGQVVERI